MTITAGGNVGVGTTSPQAILDVNGSGTAQSAIIVPRDSTATRPTGINGMLATTRLVRSLRHLPVMPGKLSTLLQETPSIC